MRARARQNAFAIVAGGLGATTIAWLGLVGFAWSDYDFETAPAYLALVHGHVHDFLVLSPIYAGSLVLRAPFALAASLLGGGELAVFRAVSVPCLLASVVFGVWLVAQMRLAGQSRLARAVVLGLCVASPIIERALEIGHPEELLGAVLCVAAVLVARRGHVGWAGLLLGLAVANKAWALVAVGPVVAALPAGRWRAAGIASLVAVVVLAPVGIELATGGSQVRPGLTTTSQVFQPWQAWWFLGSTGHRVVGGDGHVKPGYRTPPGWLSGVSHPLIVLLTVPLTLLWLRRRSGRSSGDELLLLALLLLLRCVLDPLNTSYYALPCLLALLTWEAITRRGPPVLALAGTAAVWLAMRDLPARGVAADLQSAAYLALAVPAVLAFAVRLYGTERWRRPGRLILRRHASRPAVLGRSARARDRSHGLQGNLVEPVAGGARSRGHRVGPADAAARLVSPTDRSGGRRRDAPSRRPGR